MNVVGFIKSKTSTLMLSLAVINMAIFVSIAVVGFERGVTYPHPPHWFEVGSTNCFWAALYMTVVSLILLLFPINKRQCAIAGAVNFLAVAVIAFLTTKG
jgi:hypothetical protein